MTDQAWLARYYNAKNGVSPQQPQYAAPPPPQVVPGHPPQGTPQPPPGYGYPPPPPQYPPAPPQGYVPAPQPTGPPHAPFGYDPSTGVPVAPYGRDQYGNIVVQPYVPQQPYQPQQMPMHDPRGQVQPLGYGQPPYGQPGVPQQPQQPLTYFGEDGQERVDWSTAPTAWQGGQGTAESRPCPRCSKGALIATDATGEGRKLNVRTGEFAYPAAHCSACGYSDLVTPGESTGAMVQGIAVQQGEPRMAPGARTVAQVQGQHGLPNLFAPRPAA